MATCTRCRDAIDAEIADGAVAPFDSLNTNLDCEYCPFCIFNAGGAVQVAPAKHCPTTTDVTDGTKKVLDTRGIAYGIGGEDFPISVTETCVKFMSQAIMDADASGKDRGASSASWTPGARGGGGEIHGAARRRSVGRPIAFTADHTLFGISEFGEV